MFGTLGCDLDFRIKKIHILTTFIIALTAREAPPSSDSSPLGATDLIASGDWTVPREGEGHFHPFLSKRN